LPLPDGESSRADQPGEDGHPAHLDESIELGPAEAVDLDDHETLLRT
jgi:hypothetical protein